MRRLNYTRVMEVYRWLSDRKDGGLTIRPVDIERQFGYSQSRSCRLRQSYLDSRGVFFGKEVANNPNHRTQR